MEKERLQIFAILVIVIALAPGRCRAQSAAQKNPNRMLEIAPDAQSSPAAHDTRFSDQNNAFNPSNPDDDNDIAAYENNTSSAQPAARRLKPLPYLGISVQPVSVFQWTGLQRQRGLLVLSVDSGSPAAAAGIRGNGQPTKLGATGQTAGALLGPAEFLMEPILKKTGQLGQQGDMIVAADDNRVGSEQELAAQLEKLRPGDTLWLSVLRESSPGGRGRTLKIPVKVGPPRAADRASSSN